MVVVVMNLMCWVMIDDDGRMHTVKVAGDCSKEGCKWLCNKRT